jgi:hypothetical protein
MKINQRIKLIHTTEGFTQSEFAKLIGVSNDIGVRQIESGRLKEFVSGFLNTHCGSPQGRYNHHIKSAQIWLKPIRMLLMHQLNLKQQ